MNRELLSKVSSLDQEITEENSEDLMTMKEELKKLCIENDLEDLSENIEMLLTYILFPNIALKFFKTLR